MKKIFENQYLSLIVRLVIGFLFIFAGLGKAADPALFAKEIMNYSIMQVSIVNIMALTMPWIELVVGILLIAGVRIKANALITGGLMLVFIVAVFSAMLRGLNINCGCFTGKIVLVGWPKILENTMMFIGCLYIFLFPVQKFSVENIDQNNLDNTSIQ
jgi:putative oxidoreductase